MPESQSRCEFQRGSAELGLGAAGDLLGKRLGPSPHISIDRPSEKKARSKSPPETLLLPELGPGMAPEEHYRRLVSALSEAGTFEDPQRLYHLGLPSHDLLRVRQEVAAAAVRSPSGLEVHLPSTGGQRRKQGLAQHREVAPAATPSFPERYWARDWIAFSLGKSSQKRPPRRSLCLLLGFYQLPFVQVLAHAPSHHRAIHEWVLKEGSSARSEHSQIGEDVGLGTLELPQPPPGLRLITQRPGTVESAGGGEKKREGSLTPLWSLLAGCPERRARPAPARPNESKETTGTGLWAQDGSEDEPPKDSDGEDTEVVAPAVQGLTPGHTSAGGGAGAEGKRLLSGPTLPPALPQGLPYTISPYFHTGTAAGLFADGEEATAPEDVSKWTVDDVCSFVGGLSGCGEYAPIFREQGIDGETLPLLTEEHLLTTMGLKLGPALKIRAQVARRLGRVFYMASFPVALPLQPPPLRAPEQELMAGEESPCPETAASPYGRASPQQENETAALLPGAADRSQPLC
uniref:SAM domain-containing protein n=1 Tax=Loxodonta africana TaxID=9785 RepID=G3TZF6_LOXAF